MALNISSTQIYGGRYHIPNMTKPDLFDESVEKITPDIMLRDTVNVDTVTFSDEGLAKSKDWRSYTWDHPGMNHESYEKQIEEINRSTHTTNVIDTSSLFNCELGEVAEEIKKSHGIDGYSSCSEDSQTILAKAYQVIYDRIEEDFSDPDRETTYLYKDGEYVEETKQDRIDALNKAYNRRAEGAAAAASSIAEIDKYFGKAKYSTDYIEELRNKVMESYQNAISEKNLERLRQKVTSLKDYSLDFGISQDWRDAINSFMYRNTR